MMDDDAVESMKQTLQACRLAADRRRDVIRHTIGMKCENDIVTARVAIARLINNVNASSRVIVLQLRCFYTMSWNRRENGRNGRTARTSVCAQHASRDRNEATEVANESEPVYGGWRVSSVPRDVTTASLQAVLRLRLMGLSDDLTRVRHPR